MSYFKILKTEMMPEMFVKRKTFCVRVKIKIKVLF